jgi:hypothetical protein
MKKLLVACALSAAAIAPTTAAAAEPAPSDFKNAAKYCKSLKAASGGSSFATMFGTKKNAYGKCVSSTAKKQADEDAKQEKAAKTNAAKQCKAERDDAGFAAAHGGTTFEQFYGSGKGKNAYGKCVSQAAKQDKAEADAEDEAQEDDRVSAAKTCKQAKTDAAKFQADYGSRRNAFGKCVSRTAKQLAEQRKAETE